MINAVINLPGVPKGFQAVRWGVPAKGEWICCSSGCFVPTTVFEHCCLIVEPIGDDDNIRPFKDADDFLESLSGSMMLLNITTGSLETVLYVDDDGIETVRSAVSYEDLMMGYEFPDGRACGHENQ